MKRLTTTISLMIFSSLSFSFSLGTECKAFDLSMPCKKDAWDIKFQSLNLKPSYNPSFGNISLPTINGNHVFNDKRPDAAFGYSLAERTPPVLSTFNAELGQTYRLSPANALRFRAGVQYLDLKLGVNQQLGYQNAITNFNHRVSGLGPRLGVNLTHALGKGLSIYTNTASTLIMGRTDDRFSTTIPAFEEKFGVQFQQPLSTSQISLYAGYLWLKYFNTFFNEAQPDTNYALNGPFAGIKWRG